jgi:hypothetical protein
VRLSPLGTSATKRPIPPAPDARWWMGSSQWNKNWQGKPKYSEKTYPSDTLSTTNPTLPDLGSYSGRRSEKPATNRLRYGTPQPRGGSRSRSGVRVLVVKRENWLPLSVPLVQPIVWLNTVTVIQQNICMLHYLSARKKPRLLRKQNHIE